MSGIGEAKYYLSKKIRYLIINQSLRIDKIVITTFSFRLLLIIDSVRFTNFCKFDNRTYRVLKIEIQEVPKRGLLCFGRI